MKINKKARTIAICIAVFSVFYVFLALRPLSTELHLAPEWTEDISHLQEKKDDDILLPFHLSQSMGYFTPDGRIVSLIMFPFKGAISESYYAAYSADSSSVDFFKSDGSKAGVIEEYGFPYFADDKIFVFLPGGSSFVQCNSEGKREWLYESYAPVTAFSSSEGGTVAGFADGTLVSFAQDGTIDQKFMPGGSKYSVILGAGISKDGKTVACVSGQNQQRFVVARKNGEHSQIIFHEYLPDDFNNQVVVAFNDAMDTVYYNYKGGIGIVDLKHLKSSHLPLEGLVTQIVESKKNNLIYVLSRNAEEYTVTIIEPFDNLVGSFHFKAKSAFVQVKDDMLFIGRDNKISRLSVSRK